MRLNNHDLIFVILVGGKSSRMGEDKAFLPIGKKSNFVMILIKKIYFFTNKIFISLKQNQSILYDNWFPKDSIIFDQDNNLKGPLCGLLSTYQFLKNKNINYKAIFVLAVDTPYIRLKSIFRLIETFQKNPKSEGVFYVSKNGVEPLCAIYNRFTLESWSDENKHNQMFDFSLQKRINNIKENSIFLELPKNEERFMQNINTKEDLKLFQK
ncbi:molybdenum cofactor guanylyltransferase [Leptospira sp. WS39.C2]